MNRELGSKNRGKVARTYSRKELLTFLNLICGYEIGRGYLSCPVYNKRETSIDSLCLEFELLLRTKGLVVSQHT